MDGGNSSVYFKSSKRIHFEVSLRVMKLYTMFEWKSPIGQELNTKYLGKYQAINLMSFANIKLAYNCVPLVFHKYLYFKTGFCNKNIRCKTYIAT